MNQKTLSQIPSPLPYKNLRLISEGEKENILNQPDNIDPEQIIALEEQWYDRWDYSHLAHSHYDTHY